MGNIYKALTDWNTAIRLHHIAHSMGASHSARMHKVLGIAAVILSTVVGSTIFSTFSDSVDSSVIVAVGFLSIAAAILSSLQTFLSYSEDAEKHKSSAVKYAQLQRKLEQVIASEHFNNQELDSFMKKFRDKWNQAEVEAPAFSQKIHDKAKIFLNSCLEQEKVSSL